RQHPRRGRGRERRRTRRGPDRAYGLSTGAGGRDGAGAEGRRCHCRRVHDRARLADGRRSGRRRVSQRRWAGGLSAVEAGGGVADAARPVREGILRSGALRLARGGAASDDASRHARTDGGGAAWRGADVSRLVRSGCRRPAGRTSLMSRVWVLNLVLAGAIVLAVALAVTLGE